MTALLLFKQRIKNFYSDAEVFLLPIIKFLVAFGYFHVINQKMGFMTSISNIYIELILALLCAVLPSTITVYIGFALMIAHCYAVSLDTAAFMVVLLLFMLLMFMRFSKNSNIVIAVSELLLGVRMPALLSVGTGLRCETTACLPAGCGVILYYFLNYVSSQASVLQSVGESEEMLLRVKTLSDGMVKNTEMWLMVVAVMAVVIMVSIIRNSSVDYAWRIAIIVGSVFYILIILAGSLVLGIQIDITEQIITTVVSVIFGLIIEFFFFGGDYTRVEKLVFEDDDYFYYVKAVPKSTVTTASRSIKKINGNVVEDEKRHGDSYKRRKRNRNEEAIDVEMDEDVKVWHHRKKENNIDVENTDFEKKLEESLKDL